MRTLLAALLFLTTVVCHADEPYHFVAAIPVGGEGWWDCLRVDAAAQRLYVSHGTKFVVIDLAKNAVAGEIANTPGAHDIALVPELGKGFTSNGKENKVSVVDLASLQTLSKIDTGNNPDILLYEPSQKEVWCFNAKGNSATVISVATSQVVATVALPGNPEFAVCDPTAGKVYVNIEDKSVVAVLDMKTHALDQSWPIAPGQSATGLAIDLADHRLLFGCDNQLLVMLDSTTGKVAATAPIGQHIDGVVFDPASRLAFASGGDGTTTIAKVSPDSLAVLQILPTQSGARTIALDSTTHRIYLPVAKTEPAAPAADGSKTRPTIMPDTFQVLVYEPGKE